jgi:hypothetical protein
MGEHSKTETVAGIMTPKLLVSSLHEKQAYEIHKDFFLLNIFAFIIFINLPRRTWNRCQCVAVDIASEQLPIWASSAHQIPALYHHDPSNIF